MRKNDLITCTIIALSLGVFKNVQAQSQDCEQFPSNCPATATIEACQDSILCNYLIPQEFAATHKTKASIIKMMEEIAAQKKWEFYELDEMNGIGHWLDPEHLHPVPYSKRPPSEFNISFIFIVNGDSMSAWKSWIANVQHSAANNNVDNFKEAQSGLENNPLYKQYFDSAMYYANLQGQYLTQHMSEYQAALQANDTKAIKKHEDVLKQFQAKSKYFTDKANETRDKTYASARNQYEKDKSEWKAMNIHFREATLLYVKFEFNLPVAEAYGTALDPENADDINNNAKAIVVPNAIIANVYRNKKAEGRLEAQPNFAMILFGGWQTKISQGYTHEANFSLSRANMDEVTDKRIPCDKIQTISLRLEGSNARMTEFLHSLDTGRINSMIVH